MRGRFEAGNGAIFTFIHGCSFGKLREILVWYEGGICEMGFCCWHLDVIVFVCIRVYGVFVCGYVCMDMNLVTNTGEIMLIY